MRSPPSRSTARWKQAQAGNSVPAATQPTSLGPSRGHLHPCCCCVHEAVRLKQMVALDQTAGTHLLSEIKRVIAPDAAVQNDDVVLFVGHAFQEGEPSCELHGLVWSAQPAAGKLPGRSQDKRLWQAASAALLRSIDQDACPRPSVLLLVMKTSCICRMHPRGHCLRVNSVMAYPAALWQIDAPAHAHMLLGFLVFRQARHILQVTD